MADSTINGLTALTGANVDNTADQFPIWQNSASTTKKITRTELLTGIPAGTVTAPAISPTGDSNTGVYFPAADTVGVVTGGTAAITVNSSQQVGIGTGSPSSYGGTATIVGAAASGVLNVWANNVGVVNTGGSIQLGGHDGSSSTRGYVIIRGNKENATSGDYASYLSFGTRANLGSITEQMRINSAGQVGIGKTPSLGLLDVNGDAYFNTVRVGLGGGAVSTNTAVGNGAMAATATGISNSAFGYQALNALTSGTQNVALGHFALTSTTTGSYNTAVGKSALAINSTGSYNTAFGNLALGANTASDNTAVGYAALTANTSGTNNVAVGRSALAANTTTNQSTAIGRSALAACTAADNTALGYNAGSALTTGANNTIIGSGAAASAVGGTGQIVIGKGVTGQGDNTITVGITTTWAKLPLDGTTTSWTASSDERLKKDIADYSAGLDVVTALRPVTYKWKSRSEVPEELTNYHSDSDEPVCGTAGKTYHGFLAQEVKAVIDAHSEIPDGQTLWGTSYDGVQTLAPSDLIPILVNAIKQLHAEVQALKNA